MAKRRMDPVNALKLAIERERGANKFYRRAAEVTLALWRTACWVRCLLAASPPHAFRGAACRPRP